MIRDIILKFLRDVDIFLKQFVCFVCNGIKVVELNILFEYCINVVVVSVDVVKALAEIAFVFGLIGGVESFELSVN